MTKMNQYEFLDCPKNAQLILAKHSGKYLSGRMEGKYKVELYFISYFYVEIWIKRKSQEVLHTRTFLDSSSLDPYLECIDISQLFESE
jgi:hypothetical protein